MMTDLLIIGVFMLASWLISLQLKSRFKKYTLLPVNNGFTGRDVADKMLRENGIINGKDVEDLFEVYKIEKSQYVFVSDKKR
jgi:Zn-dependent membrane protease YugP